MRTARQDPVDVVAPDAPLDRGHYDPLDDDDEEIVEFTDIPLPVRMSFSRRVMLSFHRFDFTRIYDELARDYSFVAYARSSSDDDWQFDVETGRWHVVHWRP